MMTATDQVQRALLTPEGAFENWEACAGVHLARHRNDRNRARASLAQALCQHVNQCFDVNTAEVVWTNIARVFIS